MDLVIASDGAVRCIYGEAIQLRTLGSLGIRRASQVEADEHGDCLPICLRKKARFSAHFRAEAQHCKQSANGSKRTGCYDTKRFGSPARTADGPQHSCVGSAAAT